MIAHVGLIGTATSQALELLFLKNAKKFGLQLERKLTDFVQKQGSALGRLKASQILSHSPGEGAAFVAEEFAFQQSGGNGRAVEGHETVLAAGAGLMNRVCDHFLTGTRFPLD